MSAQEMAYLLAREIRNSEEYQTFISAKENIIGDQKNYKMIRDFQHKHLEIQHAALFQQDIDQEQQLELERLYSVISLNRDARNYLEAEFRISRLVNEVQKIIGEAIQDALPVGFEEPVEEHRQDHPLS